LSLGVTDPVFRVSKPQEIADYIIGYYDLILITEFFDESLILLKHLLSLDFTDIVYLKAKENSKKKFTQEDLSQETKELILKRQNIDIVLYNTANATLWRKIDHFGRSKMEYELNKFRKMKEEADPNETLLSLEGKRFMEYMKKQQHYEKDVNS
jgi:hypothetical protein